jgi:hypothetical protein
MGVPAKQITRFFQAPIGISGFSTAGGSSDTITSAITAALNTAADSGSSVPLQVGNGAPGSQVEGVQTAAGLNLTPIYNSGTKIKYLDGSGAEVYGKVTNLGSTWTLSYFSLSGGTENAFTMPASASIAFELPYVFTFDHLPYTAMMAVLERHVAPSSATGAAGTRLFAEAVAVTSANTLAGLTNAADGKIARLNVNGLIYTNLGSAPSFTVSGKTITWSAANAGFALATSDVVSAEYSY